MLTVSLAVHIAALLVGIAWSFWQVDELPLPQVAVTLAGAPPPPPPPPPAAHSGAKTKPKVKPTPKVEQLVQPQEHPKEQPKPEKEEEEDGAQAGGVEGGVKGGVQGGVVGGVVGAPVPQNTAPRMLAPQVGKGLLLIDPNDEQYRVKLPPALQRSGTVLNAIVRVCVSAQGAVTDVKILRGAGPAIDPQIPSVLGRWRYRPFTLNGQPVPFCYPLRYEISAR